MAQLRKDLPNAYNVGVENGGITVLLVAVGENEAVGSGMPFSAFALAADATTSYLYWPMTTGALRLVVETGTWPAHATEDTAGAAINS